MSNHYLFEHLWALLTTSPKRAKVVRLSEALSWSVGMAPDGLFQCPAWTRTAPLSVSSYIVRDTAYFAAQTEDASPDAFRDELVRTGLHVRAAMVKDGLWRALGKPVSQSVVVAVETNQGGIGGAGGEIDYATYVLGEALEEEGRVLYERSLVLLEQAIRENWPGWKDMGEKVLE